MSMEKAFEKILDSIVVPMNHRLSGVKVDRLAEFENKYRVTYFYNDRIDFPDEQKIQVETNNMFKMLGLKTTGSFMISFKRADDYVDI